VTDKLVHLLSEKHLEVIIIPANELPIYADVNWIEQVLLNFMTNAIRHAEERSSITVNIESHAQTIVFTIQNIGELIPEDQLEQIWERFYRSEPSRSRMTGGTGLGLSIAKRILDMHACLYTVKNTENGVSFTVTFEG
jgi:signal transduction histidine kinase